MYDLVVSAYSFLELPSVQARINTLVNLWNKTFRYLIIIENGSNGGFRVINEARDFILQIEDERNKGHVFSPVCSNFIKNRKNRFYYLSGFSAHTITFVQDLQITVIIHPAILR